MEQVEDSIEPAPPISGDDKNFLQFITERGWKYLSPCGCRAQMDKYINEDEKYKNYEIWLNSTRTIFEVRIKRDRISLKVATGSAKYYSNVYNNHLPQ